MSVLVDRDIMDAMVRGAIVIRPFDRACLGTNSYDVHLAPTLRVYDRGWDPASRCEVPLDVRGRHVTYDVPIPDDGIVLEPGELYLASTVEHTENRDHVPVLNGRSSLGRLGLSIHVTAGTGDVGFRGTWTMEMFVVRRLRVYAGIPIGQLLWFTTVSEPMVPYDRKPTAKYGDAGPLPQPSKLHEEIGLPPACPHDRVEPGENVPRRWGSWATQVCRDCKAFRTLSHRGTDAGPWQPAADYVEAIAEPEED